MFNQDEEKMECAVGNREMGFWQYKKAEIVLILFLMSRFAAFICLWILVLPSSNNLINHVLYTYFHIYFCIKSMVLVHYMYTDSDQYKRSLTNTLFIIFYIVLL